MAWGDSRKPKRKFNGKIYQLLDWYPSKQEANERAVKLRQQGRLARVTKALMDRRYPAYQVWWRLVRR